MASHYTLDKADHDAIYAEIAEVELSHAKAQENPRVIITGGQPGSGKGSLATQAGKELEALGSYVKIDPDDLRDWHPQYFKLQRENDREAASLVHPDASAWSGQLIRDAAAGRKNMVIDQTSKSPSAVIDLTSQLRDAGYQVELRVMAVNLEISEQRIHSRYELEKQKEAGVGRFVPPDVHYAAYVGLPETVAAVEREKTVDALSIYDKNQNRLYEIKQIGGEWDRQPTGKVELDKERTRAMTLQDQREQVAAYAKLAEMLEKREAEPAERETIATQHLKATRKLAADTFRQLPPAEALKTHPELAGAYAAITATRVTSRDNGLSPEQRHVVMARTRHHIAAAIEGGTTPQADYFRTAFDATKQPAAAVKEEIKQMFSLVPDSKLNAGNISAKVAVNDLQALTHPGAESDRAGTARTIIEKLNEIRNSNTESGRAEIRNAAMAVATLCSADKALAAEISNAADVESNPYIAAIIDQGHDLNAQQPAQAFQPQGPEMDM